MVQHRGEEVVELLRGWNRHLSESDRKAKFEKMAASAFVFFRGTNPLFWRDFSSDERLGVGGDFGSPRTRTWVAGDAHVANLGAFHDRRGKVVYGLNDFDEALVHDYRYDLWRMAVSVALVARERAVFQKQEGGLVNAFAAGYLEAMAAPLRSSGFDRKSTEGKLREFLEDVQSSKGRARQVKRWTRKRGRRFDLRLDKLDPLPEARVREIQDALLDYWNQAMLGRHEIDADDFAVVDFALRRDAGTGSLGSNRYYLLVRDDSGKEPTTRILDVKAQSPPAAVEFLGAEARAAYDGASLEEGKRHAMAYHAMTTEPDPFLGWLELPDGSYSVRERSPFKEEFPTGKLEWRRDLRVVCSQWGRVLATQHRRGDRNIEVVLEDHLGRPLEPAEQKLIALDEDLDHAILDLTWGREPAFLDEVREVASSYADQVALDWAAFRDSR